MALFQNGQIAIARVEGCPDIVGIVAERDTVGNAKFPTFFVMASEEKVVPLLFISTSPIQHGIAYEVIAQSMQGFFASESRRNLAHFYKIFCEEKLDEPANDYMALNVVYWLENQGFNDVTSVNAQAAADLCKNVRVHVENFIEYSWDSARSTTIQ